MKLRHHDPEDATDTAHASGDEGGDDQQHVRDRSAALLAAADAAISRALSRDSAEFLAQNRQSGGQ